MGSDDSGVCLPMKMTSLQAEIIQCEEMLKQISSDKDANSLIILDELGVTSSHSEALPLMWALSENLLCLKGALSLVATHNTYLRRLVTSTYALTDSITLLRFQICQDANLPQDASRRQEVLEDLDPALFSDQSFFSELTATKRLLAE